MSHGASGRLDSPGPRGATAVLMVSMRDMVATSPLPNSGPNSPALCLRRAFRWKPQTRGDNGRLGAASRNLILVLILGAGVAVAALAGPKAYRRIFRTNNHVVWVVHRHQEVERYGEAQEVLKELRLEVAPGEAGANRLVADVPMLLVEGGATSIGQLTATGPLVLIHASTNTNPLDVARSAARDKALAKLEQHYGPRGVGFVTFYSDSSVDAAQISAHNAMRREASGLAADGALDPGGLLTAALPLGTDTDVFLIDSSRTLAYRGALDDTQVDASGEVQLGQRTFLAYAIEAALATRPIKIPVTRGTGEALPDAASSIAPMSTDITWSNRVQRILQTSCQPCHSAEGNAPFSLESYASARSKRRTISLVLEERSMPPWMAHFDTGPWRRGLQLSEEDRTAILTWIANDAPEGDPADAAQNLVWPAWDEWVIGEPDYIVRAVDPIPIPAEGVIDIQTFTVEKPFPEDRWIQSIQLLPSTKGILHHSTIFIRPPNGPRLFLDALLPGKKPTEYPESQARFIPKGTTFTFIIHYTASGVATEDLLRLGLTFAKEPPFREVHSIWMTNNEFLIPAYAESHEITAEFVLPRDVLIKQFMPHMHYRGKSFLAEAIKPDGEVLELLHLPRWSLDWQYAYELYDPIFLPAGTVIHCTGTYDNSENNMDNPDPGVDVTFGQQSADEMLGFGMDFVDP
ncbi:MAG: hypothetical protein ACI8QS_001725 [Planctomycetota bacterium]|jgi:hypothetical protein